MRMTGAEAASARAEWKQHWPVVLAAMAGTSIGSLPSYATSLFIQPLEDEFGWSRAGISASITFYSAVGVIGAPFAGHILDKVGSRRFGLIGVTAMCVLFAALSLITSAIWSWWSMWVLLGCSALFVKPAVWTKAVSSFFTAGRGLALALTLCGTGFVTMALPSMTHLLMESFGWRGAFLGLGAIFAAIILPILWFFFFDATDKDATMDRKAVDPTTLPGWSASQGLRQRQLWQIAAAAFLATGVVTAFIFHLVPILTLYEVSRAEAVGMAGLVGLLAVVARLTVGYLFDRIGHPMVGAISIALPVLPALILLGFDPGYGTALAAVIALGIAAGGEYDAVIYLGSRYIGMRAFGFLFGIVVSALLLGVGLGPVIAGYVFDVTRSYNWFLIAAIPASILSAALVATLGRYPDHGAALRGH